MEHLAEVAIQTLPVLLRGGHTLHAQKFQALPSLVDWLAGMVNVVPQQLAARAQLCAWDLRCKRTRPQCQMLLLVH